LNAIYNFTEDWGVGFGGILLNSNRNKQTQNIRDVQSVNVENLITLKNTYNASAYFSPIYGKWSLLNKKILPFEIYFSMGVAQVTNQSDLVGSALSGSIGQLVSLGRSSAIDVNLQGLVYSTKNINNQEQSNNSLLLTIGYSVFWPEPDYR
jgi:outer membrane beta-barrel protein